MKVNIQHEEVKKGFIRKKTYHQITVDVQFSEEETQIIKDNDMERAKLLDRVRPANFNDGVFDDPRWNLEVRQFMWDKPNVYTVNTPAEAKQYEADVKDALTNFKAYLEENAGIEEQSTSFEL